MTQPSPRRTGRCMCGSVRFSVALEDTRVRACHCADCRRWAGGPLYVVGPCEDVVFDAGAELAHVVRTSEWAERGFCGRCGSGLYWRALTGVGVSLPVGLLDDAAGLIVVKEIFTDERLPFLCALSGAAQETRAEVIGRYDETYDGRWNAT